MIDLLGGLVVVRGPGAAAIERDHRALVQPHQHALAIGGIDPQLLRIVAAGRALEAGERVATVHGLVAGGVDGVHDVGIDRIHVHATVVSALSVADAQVVRGHASPRCPSIVRTCQAGVRDEIHPLSVAVHGYGDGRAAGEARKSAASDLAPVHAAVHGLVKRRARGSRGLGCEGRRGRAGRHDGGRVVLHGGSEDHGRHVVRASELLHAGAVVHEQRARPCGTAVGGAEHAARFTLLVHVALCGHEHCTSVSGVNEHRGNLFCGIESDVLPRASGISGLVDAVALVDGAAGGHVARADVHDVRL